VLLKNNWIKTNFLYRRKDLYTPFRAVLDFRYLDTSISYEDAISLAVNDIKDYDLYLGLSGGADSEYVARVLLQHGVPFTPLISVSELNLEEAKHAYDFCKQYSLPLKTFKVDKEQHIKNFATVLKDLRGTGLADSIIFPLHAYVKERNGTYITGAASIAGNEDSNGHWTNFGLWEHTFYSDFYQNDKFEIPFLFYSPEIVYQTLLKVIEINQGQRTSKIKTSIYRTPWRRKYLHKALLYSNEIRRLKAMYNPPDKVELGKFISLEDILDAFSKKSRIYFKGEYTMTVITEEDGKELCTNCGHSCHCDTVTCVSCEHNTNEDPVCVACYHG